MPSFLPPSLQKLESRSQLTSTTVVFSETTLGSSWLEFFGAACMKRRRSQFVVAPRVEVRRVREPEGISEMY